MFNPTSNPDEAAVRPLFHCRRCRLDRQIDEKFEVNGLPIYRCRQCTHEFTQLPASGAHVAKIYDDSYFQAGHHAGYTNYFAEKDLLIERGKRYSQLLKRHGCHPDGPMLDVGAAAGFLLKGFADDGWEGMGLEPNATMADYARKELGLDMQCGPMESFEPDSKFHLVTMIQVVPHFYNLHQALEKMATSTAPGGYWLIETWNKDSWSARLFGKNWHEYSPPSVLHWFSPKTLMNFCQDQGLERVAMGRPSKKISLGHARSLLEYKYSGRGLKKLIQAAFKPIPDDWTIPYPAEDLFWVLLQKKDA